MVSYKLGLCALTSDTISKVQTFTCQVKILFFAWEFFFTEILNELVSAFEWRFDLFRSMSIHKRSVKYLILKFSVADPFHFYMDPDPRIRFGNNGSENIY